MLAGRYRLGETIGAGGMGKVWRAHDEVLHRTVAVKELTAGRYVSEADRAVLHQRTQKEARAAARITHPGVVMVHDVLDHDDRPWIVMQYVDGPSLADTTKESGPVHFREAARIGLEVLGALGAAHAAGVLHRDVKPGNVLLARDGRVLLTDFGIAAIEGDSTITRTGELIGSIDYLAPERVRGSDPGPASDLWSLGVTLYTAVEGTSPFRRSSPLSTMQAVVTDEPDHPGQAGPLAPVIAALLCKDPAGRPGAAETERMLRAVLEGRPSDEAQAYAPTQVMPNGDRWSATAPVPSVAPAPVPVPTPVPGPVPVSGPVPALGPGRRRRWRTTAVAVVLAAVLGGGAGYAALQYAGSDDGKGDGSQSAGTTGGQPTSGGTNESAGTDDGNGAGGDGGTDQGGGTDGGGSGSITDGWQRVEAPEGFSLSVPPGWERQMDGDQIDFTPDNGRHLIRISVSAPEFENPYLHMLSLEQSLQRLPEYARVKLAPNTFRRQTQAALWEFTWIEEKGQPGPRHAIDQIYFSADNSTEYAIYMSGPEEDWATTRKQFDAVLQSWQPPPGDSGQ
ncbi:serine/threonine-protein kinase [Streptomyces sp. NPDC059743]|uniref:serine/threonine-protein kinase n=1 Tax=Streptomyces sp. NPDC059743 TaxID=3346928 RepID=UPI003655051D